MNPKYYKFIVAIVVTPLLINIILCCKNPLPWNIPIAGKIGDWVGFWGNYAGAIIGGLIALYVLRYTIKENAKIRESQVKTIKYTQQQTWLDNLRKQMIGDYNMLDMQSLSIVLFKLQQGEYKEAQISLLSLNRNIEFQANSSSLYFLHNNLSREEQEYNNCLKGIMIEFGCLVNDSIFLTSILPYLSPKPNMPAMTNEEIVELAKSSYDAVVKSAGFDTDTQNYYYTNSILPQIMKLNPKDAAFSSNFDNLLLEHFRKLSIVHVRKDELFKCTKEVLQYEEDRINKILE